MNRLTMTAAALAAGLLVQTQGFTQVPISTDTGASAVADAGKISDPEKAAHRTWAAVMKNIPMPGKGCFHASYPDVAWERMECKEAKPLAHHASRRPAGLAPAGFVGDGDDWVAGSTQGLIHEADGRFFTSGVTSETNATTSLTPTSDHPATGSNDYSVQLNTNRTYTPACNGYGSNCTAWQQFIYATGQSTCLLGIICQPTALLAMQYWLFDVDNCPSGWTRSPTSTELDCYTNSPAVSLPNLPVTDLSDVVLEGTAVPNDGSDFDDCVQLNYEEGFWAICAPSVLDIGSVWTQAEFNVVGDLDWSEANFNPGSQITVQLGIENESYGSNSAVCLLGAYGTEPPSFPGQGTTGETNNLTLGACQTGVGHVLNSSLIEPYIEFSETYAVPSTPCLSCGGGGVRPSPPPIEP